MFILTRVSKEYRRTGDTYSAVIEVVGRTGRVVTGAALILAFAFFAMATTPTPDIKISGTALANRDTAGCRSRACHSPPRDLSLFGEWNWRLPGWLDRLLPQPRERQDSTGKLVQESLT